MSNSRWSNWSTGSAKKSLRFASFMAEAAVDQPGGNPTGPGSEETPAMKAERLGLVSDGHGSYMDPNTNKIVARTVNGELVFYDGGEGGGATSDGEGGGETGAASTSGAGSPTFRDPDTGMVTPIPATPETPEARAAVPDATPATPPANFDDFVKQQTAAQRMASAMDGQMDDLLQDIRDEDEPEPTDLDALLGEIRSGSVTTAKAKEKASALAEPGSPAAPSVQKPRPESLPTNPVTSEFTGQIAKMAGEGKQVKAKKSIQDRIDHEVAGPRIKDYMETYSKEQQRIIDTWDEVSTVTDEDSAVRYLTEGLGYTVDKNGKISAPKEQNRARRAMGGAGMAGEGRGESRAINFEEIQALSNPEWAEVINNAEDDGGKYLQSQTIKNDIPWDLATSIYDRMDRKLQTKLDGWGKPEAAQGTFTPMGPVEFMKDAEGNFTGETNIDVMARTNYEEYEKHFSKDNAGNRGRGIFLLQKLMANGGRGQYSGLPTFYDLDTITPDHVIGRSSGDIGGGRFKDDPLNLVLDRRGLNQFKVSSQFDGPSGKERDTMKSMVNAAQKVSGAFGKVDGTAEYEGPLEENPQFQNWAAYRIDQGDFDPKKIDQRSGKSGLASYPESMEAVVGLDDEGVKQLVGKNEKKNPLGMNMRNFSMISPRAEKRPLVTNTWGGAAGGGVEYNPLTGYRRTLVNNALFDPGAQAHIKGIEEDINTNKKYAKWSEEKKSEYVNKARRDWVDYNIFGPQKAIATLYGLGYINNDEFVDRLKEFATDKSGFMKESNPAEYESMMSDMEKTLEEYRTKLNKTMPEGPYRFEESELSENLSQPYIRAVMSSNYGRSKMPQSLVKAFDSVKENAKFTDKMYEETGEPKTFKDFLK